MADERELPQDEKVARSVRGELPGEQAAAPRVLLVTSDREHCGIREYGRMLAAAVGPNIIREFPNPGVDALFDAVCCKDFGTDDRTADIIHLNHHAALHASWTADHIRALQELGYGVVVTQHDTYETWDIMRERGMLDARGADYLFVHERVEGLGVHASLDASLKAGRIFHLRQPVPDEPSATLADNLRATVALFHGRRVLGVFGFDFPWKGFELAAAAAREVGWGLLVVSPGISGERQTELTQLAGGAALCVPGWGAAPQVVLAACDATAFLYSTGNSGTSSAIRMGIAARRPVIATRGCRQFRDLELSEPDAISWVGGSVAEVADELCCLATVRGYAQFREGEVGRLADRDSWQRAGEIYRTVYGELAARVRERRREKAQAKEAQR